MRTTINQHQVVVLAIYQLQKLHVTIRDDEMTCVVIFENVCDINTEDFALNINAAKLACLHGKYFISAQISALYSLAS